MNLSSDEGDGEVNEPSLTESGDEVENEDVDERFREATLTESDDEETDLTEAEERLDESSLEESGDGLPVPPLYSKLECQ